MVSAKDYPTLLEHSQIVLRKGLSAELIFVGDGPERQQLEKMAENYGISKKVSSWGFRPTSKVG